MKLLKSYKLLLCMVIGLLPIVASARPSTSISGMRCEYLTSPLSIDTATPRFQWIYTGGTFDQTALRLTIATSSEKLDTPDVWDSGRIDGKTSSMKMAAAKLQSLSRYCWRIEAWDADGKHLVSPTATFETAFIEPLWQAHWISDSHDKDWEAAPMLRRSFTVKGAVAQARLYVSAAAYGKMMLNGKAVSNNLLDPGYTHYDKRNLYAVHDLTKQLRKGENVLSAVLGNGFYNEIKPVSTWKFELARWRGRARMICELHIDYKDGSHEVVCSDDTWRTTDNGPYISNNIYAGDSYDARKELTGWEQVGYDDSAWAKATVVAAPSARLKAQNLPPIRETREFKPVAVRSFGDTIHVFDFGTNMTGLCRLKVKGERGTQISLSHGEFLKPTGHLELRNLDVYFYPTPGYAFQTDTYILKGQGTETWTPDFSYHGFRYVELKSSRPLHLDKQSLTARFIHTDVTSVGQFSCSNPMLNQIWKMTRQTYLNNLHSIPTDCPTREKNGWTADAYLAIDLALNNYDGIGFYEKWLDDFVDNQRPDGRISGIIPTDSWGYDDWIGPVWDAAAFVIPNALYNYYGDLNAIEKMWPVCERYLKYLATREEADGGVTYGIGDWVFYKTETPTPYTSTCFYFYDNALMARFAKLLHRDATPYEQKAAQLRKLINTKYFDAQKGLYANGSQAAQGLALYLDLVPKEQAQRVADNLNRMIIDNNGFLDFGTIGSKTVLRMLTRYGHVDTAYKMATKEECPSWGWWIKEGFTTLAETWKLSPEWRDASANHVFLGDVAAWYVQDLAGINFDTNNPGFSHITIAPHFIEGLDWVKASYNSVKGLISVEWHKVKGKVQLSIITPPNTTADIRVDGRTVAVSGSGRHIYNF